MDFIKYMRTKRRMTNSCTDACDCCPLCSENNAYKLHCTDFELAHPEEAQEIVAKWGEDHPLKTRAQDFFEKHPKAPKNSYGDPMLCAYKAGYRGECEPKNSSVCHACWNEPIEEE